MRSTQFFTIALTGFALKICLATALAAETSLPYARPVPGKPGLVISPYSGQYVAVGGYAPGTQMSDPTSRGKIFLVPKPVGLGTKEKAMQENVERQFRKRSSNATDPSLEGDWNPLSAESWDRRGDIGGETWHFKNGRLSFGDGGAPEFYSVDPLKFPKVIDIVSGSGPAAGKARMGIYKIENNRLTICLIRPDVSQFEAKARPSEFSTKRHDVVMMKFERLAR